MKYLVFLFVVILFSSCGKLENNNKTKIQNEYKESTEYKEITEQQCENIYVFAKLYGYVRFFYPSDEAAKVNWNKFAIYGVRYVEESKDNNELIAKLKELFLPLAALLKIYKKDEIKDVDPYVPTDTSKLSVLIWKHLGVDGIGESSSNVYKSIRGINRTESDTDIFRFAQKFPHPNELYNTDIGISLEISMPLALYKDEKGTLPHSNEVAVKRFIENINLSIPDEISAKDRYLRLADIIICWNIFQHFFPYFEEIKIDWNKELKPSLTEAYRDTSAYEFQNTLRKLTAKLNDGHLAVISSADIYHYYYPPFIWQWIENNLVITHVFNEAKEKLQLGDIVVEINHIPVVDALSKEEQYVSGSIAWKRNNNHYSDYNSLMRLLSGNKNTEMNLKIKRNGDIFNIYNQRTLMNVNLPDTSKVIVEKKPGIFYVDLTRITDNEFNNSIEKLENAKGIIFNMRGYPAKISYVFIQHLIKENVRSAQWLKPINLFPDRTNTFYNTDGRWNLEPISPYFNAKIVFIIDGRAISYAESLMGIVEYYKLGEIIGEPSAGTNGNVNTIDLPGEYNITWTGMKVVKHNGTQHYGVGILPTIPYHRTIKGIREGKDEFLLKAIEIIERSLKK
jgi:C-terminal processing protease CtpA/Prc